MPVGPVRTSMGTQSVALSHGEILDFLGTGGTAVVAFARDDDAYAIPVSYGFDPEEERFYLRLAFDSDSEKREYVHSSGDVSVVVHGETDEGWRSVVARGRLDEVTEAAMDATVAEAMRTMNVPFVTIYDRPAAELTFEIYRLVPDELTGRAET